MPAVSWHHKNKNTAVLAALGHDNREFWRTSLDKTPQGAAPKLPRAAATRGERLTLVGKGLCSLCQKVSGRVAHPHWVRRVTGDRNHFTGKALA
jgi:hypothetical protein